MVHHLLEHRSNTGGLTLLIILRCAGKYVNVYKSIKLLKGKLEMYLGDFGFHNDSFDKRSKALSMKEIMGKLDFIKFKNFCSARDSFKRMIREDKPWLS